MANNSSEVLLAYWLGLLGLLLLVVSWDLGVGKFKGIPDRQDRFCGHCATLLIVVFPGFFTTHSNHSLNTGQLVLFWISLSLVTCIFAFYAKLIWTSPKDCLYTNKFFLRYGSLYRPFKEDRRHFSIFVILYQLLVALPLFLPPGQAQLTLVATTHSLWVVLLLVFRPYWSPVLQGLKTALAAFKVVVVIVVFYAKLIEVIVPLYVVVLILSLSSSVFQKLKRYTSQDKYLISVLEPVRTTTKHDQKDHPKSALQLPPDSTEMQSI